VPVSAMIFSVVVILIWSFIPFIGYLLGKLVKASSHLNKYVLFVVGVSVGLVENSLFYFNVLTTEQSNLGMLLVFILFFLIACFPSSKAQHIE
jgi:hypothetical protein